MQNGWITKGPETRTLLENYYQSIPAVVSRILEYLPTLAAASLTIRMTKLRYHYLVS